MSSRKNFSILDLRSLEKTKIDFLFSIADSIAASKSAPIQGFGKTGALLFFEASTRTRMSFETACARLGIHPLRLDGGAVVGFLLPLGLGARRQRRVRAADTADNPRDDWKAHYGSPSTSTIKPRIVAG